MKILLVCDQFSPERSNYCYGLARSFVKMKHDVLIMSSKHRGRKDLGPNYEELDGIQVHRIPSIFIDRISWVFTPSASANLTRIARENNVDVVNSMHLVHYSTFTSANASLPKNTPLIISVLGTREQMGSALMNMLTRIFEQTIAKRTLRRANGIIADSYETKKSILRIGINPNKIEVIYDGVDTSKFVNTFDRSKSGSFNVVFVGGLRKQKGVYDLLRAIPKIENVIPSLRVLFIGDGPEREALRMTMKDLNIDSSTVIFTGVQPREKIISYLREASCFVLPSLSEGVSLALLEAAACQLPIVATKVGGTSEIMKNHDNAILTEPVSPDQLADAIAWIYRHPQESAVMGKNARLTAEKLDWLQIGQQTLEFYQKKLVLN